MCFNLRVPPWVFGVGLTVVIVVAVLMYGNGGAADDAPRSAEPSQVTARSDSPSVVASKANLERDGRAYVRAFFSRRPGMSREDYIERITPLEDPEHLRMFEGYISTDVQRAYIDQDVRVYVDILREIEGEQYDDDGTTRFEGIVLVKLIMVTEGRRSVLLPPTEYHLHMVEASENWQATYFSPVTE